MLPEAVTGHYRQLQRVHLVAVTAAASAWARMRPPGSARTWRQVDLDLDESWASDVEGPLVELLTAAQLAVATSGAAYVGTALAQQGERLDAVGDVVPDALAGVASDGRPLGSLLFGAVTTAKTHIGAGAMPAEALDAGGRWLEGVVRTQVSDAGRVAASVGIAARPGAGWTRMVNPPCCSRCAVLAGKTFRWNDGFDRHPRCDCTHVPTAENAPGDVRTSPRALFAAMSPAEQDAAFTKDGARAIRDGADIGQVVNARRGASGMAPAGARLTAEEARALRDGASRGRLQPRRVFGQDVVVTTEGTTRRGSAYQSLSRGRETDTRAQGARYASARAPRLMPESIYQIATDRQDAVRLLQAHGYLR